MPLKKERPFEKNSNLAIIGAGPAGIHMAYELHKRGYKRVKIFERTNRVGGQSHTVFLKDTAFDLGTLNFMDNYPVLAELQDELQLELVNIEAMPKAMHEGKEISGIRFIFLQYNKDFPGKGPQWWNYLRFLLRLKKDFKRATNINRDLIDEYGFPRRDRVNDLMKPTAQFLREHGLETLIYVKEFTCRAWGSVGPNQLTVFQDFIGLKGPTSGPNRPIVKGGYQSLWETIQSRSNLNIEFDANVLEVEPIQDFVRVKWQGLADGTLGPQSEDFDFVISSAPFPMKYLVNPSEKLGKLFNEFNTHNQNPCIVTLFETEKREEETIWLVNYGESGQPYTTVCVGNEHLLQNPESYQANDKVIKTALQCSFREQRFGDVSGEDFELAKETLSKELEEVYLQENVKILHQHVWGEYLISMSSSHIENEYPWTLLELQAEDNIWFIGVGACGPAIPNILGYNNMLLDLQGFNTD